MKNCKPRAMAAERVCPRQWKPLRSTFPIFFERRGKKSMGRDKARGKFRMRNFKFQTGEYYHIYNRGVDKREIFLEAKDYVRFIRSMREFNTTEVIDSLYRLDYLRGKENFYKDT